MAEREQKRDPSFILRSNSISVALTVLALVATVAGVYWFFPRRDHELMTKSVEIHRDHGEWELEQPTETELRAWSVGSLGAKVPWPQLQPGMAIIGARTLEIQKRRTGLVRYRVGEDEISVVAQRARDPAPRKFSRTEDGQRVSSWRAGKWTMVVVGPDATAERWGPLVGMK